MARTLRDRAFQRWFRLRRSLTLGVRGVVTDADGRVLLLRHTYTPGWHFPGGGVERNESCVYALTRELEEEAGVRPRGAPILFGVYANHAFFPNDHVLVYRVAEWEAVPATSVDEIAEFAFFDPLNPPEATSPGTRRRLAELFAGASISPDW